MMQVFYTKKELTAFIAETKSQYKIIGFVPTMGALHIGHLSLIEYSQKSCDITIASIFVNPTQFNDKNDLKNYPRNIAQDIEKLGQLSCDVVFVPDENEMYPEMDNRMFSFDGMDSLMEGEHRPGHFNGVAQIVSKLFALVQPDKAFFGQKDFQQVAIIKKMVQKMNLPIEIVACPIVREPDGLAMSSRNVLLTPQHREAAPLIQKTLLLAVESAQTLPLEKIKAWVVEHINSSEYLKVEYFDIVDENSLTSLKRFQRGKMQVGCIAVWAGNVRLIDNIVFNL
jgi:pantoate--beta-alanine ligase